MIRHPRTPIALGLAALTLLTLMPMPAAAQVWHGEFGSNHQQLWPFSYGSFHDNGRGAPVVHNQCPVGHNGWYGNYCLEIYGGWVRWPVTLTGPDGKGYDHVSVSANTGDWWSACGISLTKGWASSPTQGVVASAEMDCAPQASFPNHNMYAARDDPSHTGGSHAVWIYCREDPWNSCHLRVYDDIVVYGVYQPFTIDMRDVTQEAFGPSNLAPETCATFWIDGSPHHRNVEISIDWGLGAGAVTTEQIDLGTDSGWESGRCQVLPLSVLDYNVCFHARELDGLRRALTDCRTVSGGIL